MLKVLGKFPSINVRKVTWTCDELGLPYDREDWGIGFRDPHDPAFLKLNPMAQVPVLIDGDFVLWESNTIARYLANAYGGEALLPAAAKPRALIEKWMDWQATELNRTWVPAFHALARGAAHPAEAVAASVQRWNAMMGFLDTHLAAGGGHVAGVDFSLADIPVGLSVHRWKYTPIERPSYPAVETYYAKLRQRPAFAANGRTDVP